VHGHLSSVILVSRIPERPRPGVPDEPAIQTQTEPPAAETKGQRTSRAKRYLRKELERLRKECDRAKQALKEAKKHLHQKEARPTHLKAQRVWLTLSLFAGARISFRAVSRVCMCSPPGWASARPRAPNPLQPWPAVVIVRRVAVMHLRDFGFRMEIVTLLERPAELLRDRGLT
jgi:hypothetical protein